MRYHDRPLLIVLDHTAAYLAVPVMIVFYIIGYLWKRQLPMRACDIDLDVSLIYLFLILTPSLICR